MENWGKRFIEQYTEEEQESLHSLIDEVFVQNMLINLKPQLLEQICRIWWVVLGSFGNTALFNFVLDDQGLAKKICEDANIDYEIFAEIVWKLNNNKVVELAQKEEEAYRYVMFLMFSMVGIFINLTGMSSSEMVMANNPDPELLLRFYKKSSEIMDKGSNTWRSAVALEWDRLIKEASHDRNI